MDVVFSFTHTFSQFLLNDTEIGLFTAIVLVTAGTTYTIIMILYMHLDICYNIIIITIQHLLLCHISDHFGHSESEAHYSITHSHIIKLMIMINTSY